MALALVLRIASGRLAPHWPAALGCGFALGVAGLSKYHALPIGAGLMGTLISWARRQHFRSDFLFFLLVVWVGLFVTLPVWIWNAADDFASFRFQGDHGFGGLQLNLLAAA